MRKPHADNFKKIISHKRMKPIEIAQANIATEVAFDHFPKD
ncbi:hypothetical protein [Gimesia sp.]